MPAVVLVEPFDPVNVAAAARAMASFDASPLILVNPRFDSAALDPAIARGGTVVLDGLRIVDSLLEVRAEFDLLVATSGKPSSGSHLRSYLTPFELRERGIDERTALVFGRESDGLRVEEIARCDLVVSIETSERQRALNLSHAVAVMLAITSRIDESVQKRHPASDRGMRESLIDAFERLYVRAAERIATLRPARLETQRAVLSRVLARSDASEQEIRTLFGFVQQIEQAFDENTMERDQKLR